jgi:hypothetical protein
MASKMVRGIFSISEGKNGIDNGNSVPISSSILKLAIQRGLGILGPSSIEALFIDLERKGILLNDASLNYSLKQIEVAFIQAFGKDTTPLLMERIRAELQSGQL